MKRAGMASLLAIKLIGVLLSAFLVAVTFASPRQVEERVQAFAVAKVETAANDAWSKVDGALGEGGRAEKLGNLARRFGVEVETAEARRQQWVTALVARAMVARCEGGPCTGAGAMIAATAVNDTMLEKIASLRIGQRTLQDFVAERYTRTVRELIADLRHFGLVNLVVLSLGAALVVFRKRLDWRLAILSAGVTGYTAWATYNYVFAQNWAATILFGDWAGPGYQIAMILVCLLFLDWLFIRGQITRTVVDMIASIGA